MANFGWSLPPGVTQRDIDEAYGVEVPEPTCGHDACREAYNDENGDGTYPCLEMEPDPDVAHDLRQIEKEQE